MIARTVTVTAKVASTGAMGIIHRMIVVSSMHEGYQSNSYLVAAADGGSAVIIDTGGPMEPLLDALSEHDLTLAAVFNTHEHQDHTTFNVEWLGRNDVPLHTAETMADGDAFTFGDLTINVLTTPGHAPEHVALLVNDNDLFTGDALFKGSVGGTLMGGPDGYERLRDSILTRIMTLDDDVAVWPGHTDATTVGAERNDNPFVAFWLREQTNADEQVHVAGREGVLKVLARDYDGGEKALIEFDDGSCAIVGGSSVQRTAANALSAS